MSDNAQTKTTSSNVNAGAYTYVFINRPNTSFIEVLRFKAVEEDVPPKQGRISAGETKIEAKEGPIAALTHTSGGTAVHITLYFFSPNNTISEVKLDNASEDGTDPVTSWRVGGADIKFERGVPAARLVDNTSFLAGSSKDNRPSVAFTAAGKPNDVIYAWLNEKNVWKTHVLEAPE